MSITDHMKTRLRAAWYGQDSAAVVARKHRLAVPTLQKFWRLEKESGRLPVSPRPHFAKYTRLAPAPPACDPADDADSFDGDEIDAATAQRMAAIGCLASVDMMRTAHPGLDNDAAQIAPADWLAFDRKGAVPPSHAQLMEMARAFDQRGKAATRAA